MNLVIDQNNVLTFGGLSGGDVVIPWNVASIRESAFTKSVNNAPLDLQCHYATCAVQCDEDFSRQNPDPILYPYYFVGVISLAFEANSNCTLIGDGAFANCRNIKSVTIPSIVTTIGDAAFSGCSGLISITFDDNSNCTSIGQYAFANCTSLISIIIPNNVTTIENNMFYGCTSLTSITISSSDTWIRDTAFYQCKILH